MVGLSMVQRRHGLINLRARFIKFGIGALFVKILPDRFGKAAIGFAPSLIAVIRGARAQQPGAANIKFAPVCGPAFDIDDLPLWLFHRGWHRAG